MRVGSACAAHQTLSAEAASFLKHSLSLARRRGHSQVTPLHVAATLLSSRASPLRRACLKSQAPSDHHLSHHPLQCRALELCFNVALNRLPAAPGPILASQPSLSNALVAALKRAQAHQRRGCVEHHPQQQPLIAIKVELEQLILSILDDPSVSRVMREAGFSSAAVKTNLEESNINSLFQSYNNTSGGIYSTPNSPPHHETQTNHPGRTFWKSHLLSCASQQNPSFLSPRKKPNSEFSSLNEDVKVVMEVLLRNNKNRKNTVIVGDSLSMAEDVVTEIMGKVERGDVPVEFKSANFIKFEFSSVALRFLKREEVEMSISDLKRKVDSFASGVIIYTGDLKWTVEIDRCGADDVYSPVNHMILEMGKLLSWYNNNMNCNGSSRMRVWLMGTANYQTYMKFQMKQPPLDVHWDLQAVSVPSGGLGLSLNATSGQDSRINENEEEIVTCCTECKSNYEKESNFKHYFSSHSINNETEKNGSAHLPFWLRPHSLVKDDLIQLRRKYNKLCHSLHKNSHNPTVITNQSYSRKDYNYPSSYPCKPNKNSTFADSETISSADYPSFKTNQTATSLPRFRSHESCHIDFNLSNGTSKYQPVEPNLDSLKWLDDKEVMITLALGNLTYNDHAPSSDGKALVGNNNNNNENLVKLFQENIPWQSETIPSILEALAPDSKTNDGNKFISIEGNDVIGIRRFAVGIAKFVFGSSDLLLRMKTRNDAWDRETIEKALREHERLVVLVEDVDYADCELVNFLSELSERESGHAIFILTMDEGKKYSYEKSKANIDSVIRMKLLAINESEPNILDHKRKAEWDLPMLNYKSHKNNKTDQVSTNALDLNIEVDDRDGVKTNKTNSLRFLKKIKNRYVFDRDSDHEARAKGVSSSKLERAFEEVRGIKNNLGGFSVEEKVLEEVLRGSGLYLNGLFEQWVKEVFETSLLRLDIGEGERVRIRLCLEEGKGDSCPQEKDGFMGTCLPKSILVYFIG